LVYKYATTTTLKGSCDGKTQTVTGGHTSLFSPLALVINLAIAGGVALLVRFVLMKILGHQHD
jgi:hypothetical protein